MTDAPEKTAVAIVEVGPRDGFQGIGPFIPTPTKIDMLRRLAAAGLKRIEIGSFATRPSCSPPAPEFRVSFLRCWFRASAAARTPCRRARLGSLSCSP
jgi:isopropylmalate/homocitrate/citramalate synthase